MANTALSKSFSDPFRHSLRIVLSYAVAVISVSAALIVTLGLGSAMKHTPTILFFCAVMVTSWFGGLWPGILAGLLSTLALDYYFIPPIYSFVVSSEYVPNLIVFGCIIRGALGLICSVWVIPRYETLGTFLLIVFCLHGLAAWIASGSGRISYIGLQIAMAFDLGFLQRYGPTTNIDPLRDRFIGIILGMCIIKAAKTIIPGMRWAQIVLAPPF